MAVVSVHGRLRFNGRDIDVAQEKNSIDVFPRRTMVPPSRRPVDLLIWLDLPNRVAGQASTRAGRVTLEAQQRAAIANKTHCLRNVSLGLHQITATSNMYLRAAHVEKSTKALLEFIQQHPLGILTTAIASTQYEILQSSHIPWVLDPVSADAEAPIKGCLRGHMARQNPHAKALIEFAELQPGAAEGQPTTLQQDIMILFNHPDHHYVTPKFYVETKPSTDKVVPTWNYAAVQVYGKATIYHESASPSTSVVPADADPGPEPDVRDGNHGLHRQRRQRKGAWQVSDAPERYVELLKKNIIGIEVAIERIGGKFKMSQELGAGDREGVVEGFRALKTETGESIAQMVDERGGR